VDGHALARRMQPADRLGVVRSRPLRKKAGRLDVAGEVVAHDDDLVVVDLIDDLAQGHRPVGGRVRSVGHDIGVSPR